MDALLLLLLLLAWEERPDVGSAAAWCWICKRSREEKYLRLHGQQLWLVFCAR